jgi:betaine-homocysteine S-methyltransferase
MSETSETNVGKPGLLEALNKGPVICAEGYLFEMERRGYLSANAFIPEVVLDDPQALEQLHRDFVHAGSDVVLAFTYYVDREKLKVLGHEEILEKMYKDALTIAKKVADETHTLLAGNISQTNVWKPNDKEAARKTTAMFREQARWSKEGGADFIIAETISYLGEARLALQEIKRVGLPAVVNLALDANGLLRDGGKPEDGCQQLVDSGADVVGLNCFRGPQTMLPYLRRIRKKIKANLAALPVAYRTTTNQPTFHVLTDNEGNKAFPVNLEPFICTRDEMAEFAREAIRLGVSFLGGCCGTAPYHVRAMAEALGRRVEASKYSPAELTEEQKRLFIPIASCHKDNLCFD